MKARVIAVDDQPDNLLILEHYLADDYTLNTFSRGQELVEATSNPGTRPISSCSTS